MNILNIIKATFVKLKNKETKIKGDVENIENNKDN